MLLFWLMSTLAASPLWADEITLSTNTEVSSEGYFKLSWKTDSDSFDPQDKLALLQADNQNMRAAALRQKLPLNGASTLSGLSDGVYYFRVDAPGLASNVVKVEVKHHSLARAFAFFSMGLLLFCILLICIAIGHKNHRGSLA